MERDRGAREKDGEGGLLAAGAEVGGGGEEDVGAGVQRGLHGVLDHTDDEADRHRLHRDVVSDSEEGAGEGNQQQGAAGHTGGAAGGEGRDHAQQEGGAEGDLHADGVGDSHRHHRDGHGRAVHIDGGPEGYAHRVEIFIETEFLAQGHIDGNVRGGRTGEECVDTTFSKALPE